MANEQLSTFHTLANETPVTLAKESRLLSAVGGVGRLKGSIFSTSQEMSYDVPSGTPEKMGVFTDAMSKQDPSQHDVPGLNISEESVDRLEVECGHCGKFIRIRSLSAHIQSAKTARLTTIVGGWIS